MIYRILILCGSLLAASVIITNASNSEITPIRESLTNLPMQIGDWREKDSLQLEPEILTELGVDDYVNRTYRSRDQYDASLYIGYYQSQKEGDTIHSPLNCLPGGGWNPIRNERILVPFHNRPSVKINRITILQGQKKQLVLYWYQSHGRVIASEYWGKIYSVLDAMRTNRTDAALVRIICPVNGLDEVAEKVAEDNALDFMKALFPLLNQFLPD